MSARATGGNACARMYTDVNELHQDRLQVTEGGSGLHTETQLLLKVTAERNLTDTMENQSRVGEKSFHKCNK